MPYSVIICEDNPEQLKYLSTIISYYSMFHQNLFPVDFCTTSANELLQHIHKESKDNRIYFLDIDLGEEMSGLDLAVEIRKKEWLSKIVFITTHDELAHQTFKLKVEATGFIIKDQKIEDYRDEIHEVLKVIDQRSSQRKYDEGRRFIFKNGSETTVIDFDSIIYLTTSNIPHRIELFTKNGHYEFYGKIKQIEKDYPKLFKVSRSTLINPKNITKIDYKQKEIWFGMEVCVPFSVGKGRALKSIEKTLFQK